MINDKDVLSEKLKDEHEEALSIQNNGSYVKISADAMEARLCLMEPEQEKENGYTVEEILTFLQEKGVAQGLKQEVLEEAVKEKIYDTEIVAASGEPAVPGKDGYFEYKFNPEQYKTPKVLANGSVDYTSMSTLQNVKEGAVVAVYHHAETGREGYDVTGRFLSAKNGRELQPLRGQSVMTREDPDVYLASKSGKIELKNGRIDIQSVHEIREDVTLITGKVEFFGDIIIHGNVEAGVVIRAGRNIEIKGTVEAANLFAGGDIVLTRGIQGNQKAKVSVRGNMFADFIEHTVVTAGGNVQANTILNCRVSAEGKVILTGKKGAIIGGYTHGMMGIAATEIGNPAEVRTIVHAGCEREAYYKAQDAKNQVITLSREIREMLVELEELLRKRKAGGGRLTMLHEKRLAKLEKSIMSMRPELEQKMRESKELEERNALGKFAEITVLGTIYRGTVISLVQMQMPVEHTTCYMRYFQQRGLIESSVIPYT